MWKKNLEENVSMDKRVVKWNLEKKRLFQTRVPTFADPTYEEQWHLHNEAQLSDSTAGYDCNVLPAWDMGITGNHILNNFLLC